MAIQIPNLRPSDPTYARPIPSSNPFAAAIEGLERSLRLKKEHESIEDMKEAREQRKKAAARADREEERAIRQAELESELKGLQATATVIKAKEGTPGVKKTVELPGPTESGEPLTGQIEEPHAPIRLRAPGLGIDTEIRPRTLQEVLGQKRAEEDEKLARELGLVEAREKFQQQYDTTNHPAQLVGPGTSVWQNGKVVYTNPSKPGSGGSGLRELNAVNSAANQFRSDTKNYGEQRDATSRILAQLNTAPSPAGDLSMIFSYMKLLDPTSTVRETEQANAQNARGVPDWARNYWNLMLTGQRLTPSQRKDFTDRAKTLYRVGVLPQVEKIAKRHGQKLGRYGLHVEDIYDRDEWDVEAAINEASNAIAAGAAPGSVGLPAETGAALDRLFPPAKR